MSNATEIQDIISQLRDLQLQQDTLLQRLEHLSTISDLTPAGVPRRAAAPRAVSPRRYHTPRVVTASGYERNEFPAGSRVFVIGDLVRIRNPKGNQPTEGTITKITLKRITVQATDGTYITRAPTNIFCPHHEHPLTYHG
jgi:hypothetical protein